MRPAANGNRPAPSDEHAEAALLGAALFSPDAAQVVATQLCPEDFHHPTHRLIAAAVLDLYQSGSNIDPTLVASVLGPQQLDQIGGPVTLVSLQANGGVSSNAHSYARRILDASHRRQVIGLAYETIDQAYDGDPNPKLAELTAVANSRAAGTGFRRHTAAELVGMPRQFKWLVRRMLAQPTYGQIAGEQKTLKTHLALMLYIGVASGTRILDVFDVDQAAPVVAYIGEGGRIPYTNLVERTARAMGVDVDNLPLHLSFDVAPVNSPQFQTSMRRDLEELQPALFGVDPYYAYHGTATKAADLHQEGALLSSMSAPCMEAGATLLVNNHFNQTGTGGGLTRITQAGSGEWVDTWLLVGHRTPPDVDNGRFQLLLEIGSRQWGANTWDLDLNVGRFNPDTREHDGDITWEIHKTTSGGDPDRDETRLLDMVTEKPFELTKEELATGAGGKITRMRNAVRRLEDRGLIKPALTPRKRADGHLHSVWCFGPVERIPEQF